MQPSSTRPLLPPHTCPAHRPCLPQVPAVLASEPTLASDPDKALQSALVAVNAQLHASPIDDSLSGTTACCAVLQGRTLYIANVGDSRAVVAERPADGSKPVASEGSDGAGSSGSGSATELVARDLSQDQTPFRCGSMGRRLGWVTARHRL